MRFYRRIADPILLDIHVDWNGMPVENVYPQHIPDVFTAQPIVLKGRYTKPGEGDITLHGLLRGKPWSQTLHLVLPAARGDGSAIQTLWARDQIEDLQNQDWIGAQTGHPIPDIKERIINTALEYRLMSQYTSFVAVEEQVVNVGGRQRTVDVPVDMPQGVSYEGVFGGPQQRVQTRGSSAFGSISGGGSFGGGRGGSGGFGGAPGPGSGRLLGMKGDAGPSGSDDMDLGTEEGKKLLRAMKPAERKTALRKAKLVSALRTLPETFAKEGRNGALDKPGFPKVERGRIEVQIRLNSLPPNGLQALQALGFELDVTLQPNRLLLGTIAVDRLDALIELDFVRRVELPRIR